jgi:hypothetical protein
MAFLLSPKTGGGDLPTYELTALPVAVSIDGAPAQKYLPDAPGTVKPGSVINTAEPMELNFEYFPADPEAHALKIVKATTPYTVEEVAGAAAVNVDPNS